MATNALASWSGTAPDAIVLIRGGGAVNDLANLNDLELTRWSVIGRRAREVQGFMEDIRERALRHINGRKTLSSQLLNYTTTTSVQIVSTLRTQIEQEHAAARESALKAVATARESVRDDIRDVRANALKATARARDAITMAREVAISDPLELVASARASAMQELSDLAVSARSHVRQSRMAIDAELVTIEPQARATIDWARNLTQGAIREVVAQGPEKTLRRGFALVKDQEGKPLPRGKSIPLNQPLRITFQDGDLTALPSTFEPKE